MGKREVKEEGKLTTNSLLENDLRNFISHYNNFKMCSAVKPRPIVILWLPWQVDQRTVGGHNIPPHTVGSVRD